jgi:hypothetical protein
MFVSNCEIIPTLILVQSKLDLNNLTGEVSEFIFHLARLLCVTQSQTSAALDILEKWLLDLPWDDKPRRENTEPVRVLNQKYVVSKRFHGAIIDALLVQISSQLKQNAALLSIILYVVYKNRRTGAGTVCLCDNVVVVVFFFALVWKRQGEKREGGCLVVLLFCCFVVFFVFVFLCF